jgi:hypothetical protein
MHGSQIRDLVLDGDLAMNLLVQGHGAVTIELIDDHVDVERTTWIQGNGQWTADMALVKNHNWSRRSEFCQEMR